MLGTWGLRAWVAGAAPDRFLLCVPAIKELSKRWKEGNAVRHPQTLSSWALQPTCPRHGLRDSRDNPLHHPELSPLPWFLLANAQQRQHLIHFIRFKTQWSDVTFLLLFLEKCSLRTNFPYFLQAAKHTNQAEAFFLNASGGCGSNSSVSKPVD